MLKESNYAEGVRRGKLGYSSGENILEELNFFRREEDRKERYRGYREGIKLRFASDDPYFKRRSKPKRKARSPVPEDSGDDTGLDLKGTLILGLGAIPVFAIGLFFAHISNDFSALWWLGWVLMLASLVFICRLGFFLLAFGLLASVVVAIVGGLVLGLGFLIKYIIENPY